jgi:hypothetical protein
MVAVEISSTTRSSASSGSRSATQAGSAEGTPGSVVWRYGGVSKSIAPYSAGWSSRWLRTFLLVTG